MNPNTPQGDRSSIQPRPEPKNELQSIRHQRFWIVGPLCKYSTLLKLYSRCRAPLPTIHASSTAPAALLPPIYRPLSTMKPASAASLSLARHCLTMVSTSSSGAVLGMHRITSRMGEMVSGTIQVFRVKRYRVSASLRTGKTSLGPEPLVVASSRVPLRFPGVPYTRHIFHNSNPCLKEVGADWRSPSGARIRQT